MSARHGRHLGRTRPSRQQRQHPGGQSAQCLSDRSPGVGARRQPGLTSGGLPRLVTRRLSPSILAHLVPGTRIRKPFSFLRPAAVPAGASYGRGRLRDALGCGIPRPRSSRSLVPPSSFPEKHPSRRSPAGDPPARKRRAAIGPSRRGLSHEEIDRRCAPLPARDLSQAA
jgi:hypothetical protein